MAIEDGVAISEENVFVSLEDIKRFSTALCTYLRITPLEHRYSAAMAEKNRKFKKPHSYVEQILQTTQVASKNLDAMKCTIGGGSCSFDTDCCSDNCHSGRCQTTCGTSGTSCTYDHECCQGNCNRRGYCGNEEPGC